MLMVFFSSQLDAQSIMLDLLFRQSKNVFKGKVEKISYISSNGEGSSFAVAIKVEKFYKGNKHYAKIVFGADKSDIIDLELDTIVMDYAFQISQGSSYVFFTDKIVNSNDSLAESGFTWLKERYIEGIPFTKELDIQLDAYDKNAFLEVNHKYYTSSNFVFNLLRSNSSSIFLGKVNELRELESNAYKLKVSTINGDVFVITKNMNCICEAGTIRIGQQYIFYTNKDEANNFRLVDEWLGIIQASEYDKVKYNK